MRRVIGSLLVSAVTVTAAFGQVRIGEVQMLGTVAWAPGAHPRPGSASEYPLPQGRVLVGAAAGLSFVAGDIRIGPEALVLRGNDRRMFSLGGVARLVVGRGELRPYVLLGAGVYTWNHKASLPPIHTSRPGLYIGPAWLGDVTHWAGNAGGGVMVGGERLSFMLEIRGHKSLSEDDRGDARDALGFSFGGRLSW